ncbi:hypothetical protein HLK59_19900 [Streptomyces sp. S3(2020)]|uniref:hypothetical protein n=1 Tax=Streptomyces sp. S3(2020) TaxID=2732044 RepID=UPI001488EA0E|nr:hypothetical protein [Streptomyces sp. S3(2020)]NNN32586.1 hypothetical protein [Streptomyces sp. S3(2020)]
MTAEHRGVDALMAAITDEPPPEDADAAFLAEHRKAAADVALLREQLGIIGDALAEPPPSPAVSPKPAPARLAPARRRAALRFAFGGLAVAAAASVVAGLGWLVAQGGGAANDATASKADGDSGSVGAEASQSGGTRFGSPHYLACTRLVAEGTITSVERLADGVQLRISVDVIRYYKQEERRPEHLTYVVEDTFAPGLVRGDRVLFGVPKGDAVPDHWVVGEKQVAQERAWITASLPESRGLSC